MSVNTLNKVLASPKLPTLPTVAVKLMELTRDPEVDLQDVADLVQYDQSLAAKILRTVNSSYYALAQPCPTIKRALTYLGLTTVKSLVLGFSLVDLTRHCRESFDLVDYWRRCVYSAAAARRIAMVTGRCDPDEAFLAALMQDVGMLALHTVLGNEYDQVVAGTNGNHLALPHCETDVLGFTHADAGALLGEQWNLPRQIVDPIRQHHQRSTPYGDFREIINAVILAYRISNLVATAQHKHVLDMISAMSHTMFHMSAEDERAVLTMVTEDVRELGELLEVNLGNQPDIQAILAEADDALARNGQDAAAPAGARADAGMLRDALTDIHTGLGNRQHFEAELGSRFNAARSRNQSLGLLLIEIDRFASLKDQLGQPASDMLLKAISQRLREGVGEQPVVMCRYGDEQFTMLLPESPLQDAARTAERVRRQVERGTFDLRGTGSPVESVAVTASIGVAALEPPVYARFTLPDMLVQLADRALSAARRQGRNCVRIFNPTPRARRSGAA